MYGKRKNLMPDNLRVTDVPKMLWVVLIAFEEQNSSVRRRIQLLIFHTCLEIFRRITTRFYRKMHVKNENCGFSSEAIWLKLDPLTRLPANFTFPWITRHKILHFSHTLTGFFLPCLPSNKLASKCVKRFSMRSLTHITTQLNCIS